MLSEVAGSTMELVAYYSRFKVAIACYRNDWTKIEDVQDELFDWNASNIKNCELYALFRYAT
jgi:hypothetical protein